MFVHEKLASTRVNGPGNRSIIFFQGCRLNCPSCQNPKTHPILQGTYSNPEALALWVLQQKNIEGVTFSGGEPLEQLTDGLLVLAKWIKRTRPELTIGMFTGYTEAELESGNFNSSCYNHPEAILPASMKRMHWEELKKCLDFAVMGRFNQQVRINSTLRSSANQKLVFFSDRYSEKDFGPLQVEMQIDESAELVHITGFPTV